MEGLNITTDLRKEVYVVNAYRWNDRERHSYTVGVFDVLPDAISCAESHTDFRGGKYSCLVEKCILNKVDNDMDYTDTVYSAIGRELKR